MKHSSELPVISWIFQYVKKSGWSCSDLGFLIVNLCLLPIAWLQFLDLWIRPHFQFFPIAWGAFFYFSFKRSSLCWPESMVRFWAGWSLMALSFIAGTGAVLVSSPWLGYVAMIMSVFSWSLLRLGQTNWSSVLAVSTLLLITVSLPFGYDQKLISSLQALSSSSASLVLDSLGVVHLREGNVLQLASKKFFVDEACSGVDSLYALMAISLGMIVFFRMPLIVGIGALSMVPVWASCSNLLRLLAIALGYQWIGIDLSHGLLHTILGCVVFVLAFVADFLYIQFLGCIFSPCSKKDLSEHSLALVGLFNHMCHFPSNANRNVAVSKLSTNWFALANKILISWMLVMFGALGGYSAWAITTEQFHRIPQLSQSQLDEVARRIKLPNSLGRAKLVDFEMVRRQRQSVFGEHSCTWKYEHPDGNIVLSIDFPFRGFHELTECYQVSGWSLYSDRIQKDSRFLNDPSGRTFQQHSVLLGKDNQRFACLIFSLFELDGTPIRSRASGFKSLVRFEQSILEPIAIQVQIFFDRESEVNDEMKHEIDLIFRSVAESLSTSLSFLEIE